MISQSLLKLLSGNHFSIFSNSDLDLDPSDPKNNPNLPFLIRFLYTKFHVDISFLTKVIVRKRQKLTNLVENLVKNTNLTIKRS